MGHGLAHNFRFALGGAVSLLTGRKSAVVPRGAKSPRKWRRGRAAFFWGAGCFVALNAAFATWADLAEPSLYDPEYACREAIFLQRRAERPDQKLLVFLGSSRVVLGVRPERLPPLTDAAGREIMPFNISHTSAGPVYANLTFHHLVRDGHVPDYAVIEVMPPLLGYELSSVYMKLAVLEDMPDLCKHVALPRAVSGYVGNRFLAVSKHRQEFMMRHFPDWLPPSTNWLHQPRLDSLGGEKLYVNMNRDPAAAVAIIRKAIAERGPCVPQLKVAREVDSAMRSLLAECRERGVRAALLLLPESPEFQQNYTPQANQELKEYLDGLCRDYGCRLVDARSWLTAEGDYADGHHLHFSGQAAFTDRLGREFLTPWVREQ